VNLNGESSKDSPAVKQLINCKSCFTLIYKNQGKKN
jgi:hypothetical protein